MGDWKPVYPENMGVTWETVSAFPPPYPMCVHLWGPKRRTDQGEGGALHYTAFEDEDVFLMLSQRRVDGSETRIVPGVINRHGAVTAIEVGDTNALFTIVTRSGENLGEQDWNDAAQWMQLRNAEQD